MSCSAIRTSLFIIVLAVIFVQSYRPNSLSCEPKEERYPLPIIAIDTLSASTVVVFDSPTTTILGATGYALGSPLVHFLKGNTTGGFLSLSLRTSLPLVALWLTQKNSKTVDKPPSSTHLQTTIGVAAFALPMLIDWVWLAQRTVNPTSQIQPVSFSFSF